MNNESAEPGLTNDEVDARFADLVADWSPEVLADLADPTHPVGPGGPLNPGVEPRSLPGTASPGVTTSFPVWRGASGPPIDEVVAAEEEEGFTPRPVDLPPAEDLHYWGALAGLVLGPLLVIWVVLAHPFYGTWWALAGIALFVGGFILVVLRGPRDRDPDEDNGARV